MKLFKKVTLLATSAAMIATLFTGCGSKVDEAQQKVDNAVGAVVISGYTQAASNLTIPSVVTKNEVEYQVEWSSNSDRVNFVQDGNAMKAVFDFPIIGKSEAISYDMIATIKDGDKTASRTFSGYIMPIREFASVSEIHTAFADKTFTANASAKFVGIVNAITSSMWYVTDGTNNLLVYKKASTDGVKLGDQVEIIGPLTKYGNTFEYTATIGAKIISSNNPYSNTPVETTAEGLLALDDKADPTVQGKFYSADLKVVKSGNFINFQSPDGTIDFQGYNMTTDSQTAIAEYADKVVNIPVLYYSTYFNSSTKKINPRIIFVGGADDIKLVA